MTLKTTNPQLKPHQVRESLATSANPVNFQNKTPCADCFVLLNHPRQAMTYRCMDVSTVFFSPEPGSKNKDGEGACCCDDIFFTCIEL